MEYYVAGRKKELIFFGTAWMDPESILISAISQSEKDKYHMIRLYYVESNEQTKITKWRQSHRHRDMSDRRGLEAG